MDVKCRYCGAKLPKQNARCVTVDGKNTFYCNDEHYDFALRAQADIAKAKKEYDAIFEITRCIFGYNFQGYAILKREILEWERIADRRKILSYLTDNKDWLSGVLRRVNFQNDYNRVRYYSKVVASNLHDYKPRTTNDGVVRIDVDMTVYDMSYSARNNKRRSLIDLEDDIDG